MSLNFTNQTIQIKKGTLEKTLATITGSFSIPTDSFGLQISFDDLESLLGKLEFLANISLIGRTKTSNLVNQLREARRNDSTSIVLSAASYQEMCYWTQYCQSPTILPFFRDNLNLYELSFSDAAGGKSGKWAYYKYDSFCDDSEKMAGNGSFPSDYQDMSILLKETYALFQLCVVLPPNRNHQVMIDNQTLLHLWNKTRSSTNLTVNEYLSFIMLELLRKNISLELTWIPTSTMNLIGADRLSRNDYSQLHTGYSLSNRGITFIRTYYFNIDVDLFASKANHWPGARYYSSYQIEDPLFTGYNGQYGLQIPMKGNFLLFPDVPMTKLCLNLLSLNPSRQYNILILIRTNFLPLARSLFKDRPNFFSQVFEKFPQNHKLNLNTKLHQHGVVAISFGPSSPSKVISPFGSRQNTKSQAKSPTIPRKVPRLSSKDEKFTSSKNSSAASSSKNSSKNFSQRKPSKTNKESETKEQNAAIQNNQNHNRDSNENNMRNSNTLNPSSGPKFSRSQAQLLQLDEALSTGNKSEAARIIDSLDVDSLSQLDRLVNGSLPLE